MTDRKNLIELLDDLGVIVNVPDNVDDDGCGTYTVEGGEYVADYLLANGVIVPVRCKDCKHCDPHNKHCDSFMGTTLPYSRKETDFCSYGELKERERK